MSTEKLPFSMRISSYKTNLSIGVFSLLLLIIAFGMKLGGKKGRNEADFISATHAFLKWEEVLDLEQAHLETLTNLMRKHPELNAEYEGKITQDLIAIQKGKKAKEFGSKVIERTNQPYFKDYALTSMLIGEKHFAQALEQAILLKRNMLQDDAFWEKGKGVKGFGSGLFAFNLMRIATLYQELGMGKRELEAWNELKAYGGWSGISQKDNRISSEGFQALLSHFTVQEISLLNYISAREAAIGR